MAISYSGTVLSAPVVVGTDLDNFPTHKSEFGKGGWHEVATIAERDAIPAERRTAGMAVFVTGTSQVFTLDASLDNWTDMTNIYQAKIDENHKVSADYISDGTTNKTVTATEKSTWSGKQEALVSGTNIKTINNQSLLGSGNIEIQGGGGDATWGSITGTLSDQTDLNTALGAKLETTNLIQGSNISLTKNGNNVTIAATGSLSSTVNWGDIQTDMSNQTDLQNELNRVEQTASDLAKYNEISEYLTRTIENTGTIGAMSPNWVCNAEQTPGVKGGLLTGLYSSYELSESGNADIEIAILDVDFVNETYTMRRQLTTKVTFATGTRAMLTEPVWVGSNQYVAFKTKTSTQCKYKASGAVCMLYNDTPVLNEARPFKRTFANMDITMGCIFNLTSTPIIDGIPQLTSDVNALTDIFKEDIVADILPANKVGIAATNNSVRYITNKWISPKTGVITKIKIPDNTYTSNAAIKIGILSYDVDTTTFTVENGPFSFTVTPETSEITLDEPITVQAGQYIGISGPVAFTNPDNPYKSFIDINTAWTTSSFTGEFTRGEVPRGFNFEIAYTEYYDPKAAITELGNEVSTLDAKVDTYDSKINVSTTTYLGNPDDVTGGQTWNVGNWCVGRFDAAPVDGKITAVKFETNYGNDTPVLVGAFTKNNDNTEAYLQRYVSAVLVAGENTITFETPLEIHEGEVVGSNVGSNSIRKFNGSGGSGYFTGGSPASSAQTIGQTITFLSNWPTAWVDVRYTFVESEGVSTYAQENRAMIKALETNVDMPQVSISDMQKVMIMGSSLTAAYYSPRSASWIERVNDMVDVNLINNGTSGYTLTTNMNKLIANTALSGYGCTVPARDVKPNYILWEDSANGTETGIAGLIKYRQMKEIVDSYGAKLLMGSEENWASAYNKYEHTQQAFANEVKVPYSPTGRLNEWAYPRNNAAVCPYPVWSGGHGSYRAITSYIAHTELLNALPLYKNVKMFKVRETYKAGSPEITDLVYDTNTQRLWYWTAICPGANTSSLYTPGHIDNYDQTGDNLHRYDVPDTTNTGSTPDEELSMTAGYPVSFNKYALIEFILDKVNITKGTFTIKPSVIPTAVYIAKTVNTNQTYTDNYVRTSFEALTIEQQADGSIKCSFENDTLHQYELYDKVRIVVYYADGAFTLAKPEFKDYDGNEKKFDDTIHYHRRRFGIEMIDETNPSDASWTKSTGAASAALPAPIANYTLYNSTLAHAELTAESSTISKTFTVDNPSYKHVAVRVVGQIWNKIATTRFQGTEYEDSPYIADNKEDPLGLAAYVPTDYDYGTIRVTLYSKIGNDYVDLISKDLTVLPGWTETYFEADLTPDDTDMKIEVKKLSYVDDSYNNDDKPIFIHDVSMQELGVTNTLEITNYTV